MVVPPFGFGVGDFLAVAKLTGKIASELKDNGEAASKYQGLIIELESLERALSRLYTLKPTHHELVHLDAIRAAATACKRPLESFLAKIEKFDKRLGTRKTNDNKFKGAGRRIQFNTACEEDVKELRTTLASHVLTINTLLMTQMLDSITTAETDRADNVENLKILLEAHAPLLHNIIGRQCQASADMASCKDNLDSLLDKVSQSQTQGAAASVQLDDHQDILEAIKSEVELLKERFAAGDIDATESTPTDQAISSSFKSALVVTSNLVLLVLSGTTIVSAHALANQARNISVIARKFELNVLPVEQSVDKPLASTAGPAKETGDSNKSCSSAITNAIDTGRPAIGSDARTYKGNVCGDSPTAVMLSQEDRASQSQTQPTYNQGKRTENQCSPSCDSHLDNKAVEQSEICPDQKSWNRIWDSATELPVPSDPLADDKKQFDLENAVSIAPSKNPLSQDQILTPMKGSVDSSSLSCQFTGCNHICASALDLESHAKTHSPPQFTSRGQFHCPPSMGRASKMSLSRSKRRIDGYGSGQPSYWKSDDIITKDGLMRQNLCGKCPESRQDYGSRQPSKSGTAVFTTNILRPRQNTCGNCHGPMQGRMVARHDDGFSPNILRYP